MLLWLVLFTWTCCNSLSFQAYVNTLKKRIFIFSKMGHLHTTIAMLHPSLMRDYPTGGLDGEVCWIPSPFTRPHTTRLLFMGIPKRQSLRIETHNNFWIESNHWKWMLTNTEGIASWCVLLHHFALSAVSGPEWTSIWETAVTKREKDVVKFFYMLKMKQIIIKTWFAVIWSVYTSFWDTLYMEIPMVYWLWYWTS